MASTSGWKRKAGATLLFLLGFGIGVILRRFLIPLQISVEELVWPWIAGSIIFLVIVGGVLATFAAVLYRYRYRHSLVVALGWGIWGGLLVHSLLLFVLSLMIFMGGITPAV